MKVCIIGAGTYGSYTAYLLASKFPNIQITMLEVGDSIIKTEDEIGFLSFNKGSSYSGLKKGRFFGFGGSSVKWGGQLLMYSKNDFISPGQYLKDIVTLNEKYKYEVHSRFGLENTYEEKKVSELLYTKEGIWLSYFNRNLFKYFRIKKNKRITIIPNARVVKIEVEGKRVVRIQYIKDNKLMDTTSDFYFLTAGAFESNRILLNSDLINSKELKFSDHLSQKVFKIKNSTFIGKEDFAFKIKGTSLITKRFIGEIDNISFFAHPIFNSEFKFFLCLKKILFNHEISFSDLGSVLADIPHAMAFIYSFVFKRKLYVHTGEWYIQLDIENQINSGRMKLSDINDRFGQAAVDIHFESSKKTDEIFAKAKDIIRIHLEKNNVDFEDFEDITHTEKYEDTYHPFGMMSDFSSVNEYFTLFENMLVINTGILPRAGSINSTAAVFPIIEEYVNSYFLIQSPNL
jgi:hypothetical protein